MGRVPHAGRRRRALSWSAGCVTLAVAGATLVGTVANASPKPGLGAGVAPAVRSVTVSTGASRVLPADYFGFNYDYGGASIYAHDGSVPRQLAVLSPGTLRWPAGAGANYFQWQQGYPTNTGLVDGYRFTLADLENAYRRTGAAPVFDLNVMTASLASQEQMLAAAKRIGLPIRYVELGNEFYLCYPDYRRAFPTAESYGRTVAADSAALHAEFPTALIAAVGSDVTKPSYCGGRAASWNGRMMTAVAAAVRSGHGRYPDAVTVHVHPGYKGQLTSTSALNTFYTIPYDAVANANALNIGRPTWLTEIGLSLSDQASRRYGDALFGAELALLLGQRDASSTLLDYWSAFGSAVAYAYTGSSGALTPSGLAMSWVDAASHGATRITALAFAGAPLLTGVDTPALLGARFTAGHGQSREVLLNLSAGAVAVPVGGAVPARVGFRQMSGAPNATPATASQLPVVSGTTAGTLRLPAYSITLVD